MKRAVAEISKSALLHNLGVIRGRISDSRVRAVLKANAYGHGAVEIARLLEKNGVDRFAVATVEEGMELRKAGIKGSILILGYTPISDVDKVAEYGLAQTIVSTEHSNELASECVRLGLRIPVHINLDTGMHRLGFAYDDVEGVLNVSKHPCYIIEGVFSHFTAADEEDGREFTTLQYERLKGTAERLAELGVEIPCLHIANSAAALTSRYTLDSVRTGLALYGFGDPELIPAMTFKTHVCAIHRVSKGESVGYSRAFTVDRDSVIATVPIGYADGIRRDYGRLGLTMQVEGCDAKCFGNVCMDYTMLDVTDIPSVRLGSEVVVFGNAQRHTACDIADRLGTVSYEVLTSPTPRVERIYVP